MSQAQAHYLTHDNGGRPFLVQVDISKKNVNIYKNSDNEDLLEEGEYKELVCTLKNYEKVFVGEDEKHNSIGHSILVKLGKYNYAHICTTVTMFETTDEITEYNAPIGNSDVVYDWATGSHNIYLLCEYKYIDKLLYDPYVLLYGHKVHSKKMKIKTICKRCW